MHPVLIAAVTVGLQILSTVVEPLMVENEKFITLGSKQLKLINLCLNQTPKANDDTFRPKC